MPSFELVNLIEYKDHHACAVAQSQVPLIEKLLGLLRCRTSMCRKVTGHTQ